MSLQIVQRPTSPNAAYTRLLYAISGSPQLTQPQFQYVMDVYESGSTNLIKRTSQTANPAETAIFDPSRIIQGQLSDDYSWKISSLTPFDSSSKTFTVKFGVQYATSTSSSATVYPDLLEDDIEIFRGVVEPNDGYYNWPSSSKAVLSNMPATMSMQFDDFGTIGIYNNSVQYVSQSFYSSSLVGDQLIQTKGYSITDNFTSVPISASTPYWNYVSVEVSSSIGKQNYRYEVSNEIHREKVRFAFINKQGTWDYFNNYSPVRQTMDVSREQFTAPRVDYSSATSTYNITRRGRTDYHNSTDDSFTTQTDYLDKTNANWIEELIESPSVYIQRNGEFIPIVITDSSYVANTNENRQKLFQYTINFKPSNQPFGTWIPEYVTCPQVADTGVPFDLVTYTPSQITSASAILSGSLGDSGSASLTEVGFVYNLQGADLPVKGGYLVSQSVGSPTQVGHFSASVSLIPSSSYQYRAYADNTLGTSYGNLVNFTTGKSAFDPTLDGTLTNQLYAWFDFSDTGSMVLDGNQPIEVISKGTYTGSLYYSGSTGLGPIGSVEYNNKGYTSISGGLGYTLKSNDTASYDSTAWHVFDTGSSFTTITVAQDFEGTHGPADNPPQIYWDPAVVSAFGRRQYQNIELHGFRNNGTPFDTGSLRFQYYLSNETANNGISSSAQFFDFVPPVNSARLIIYNYSGSNASDIWESRFFKSVYNTGSLNSDITVGRYPSNSISFTDEHRSSTAGYGLFLRSPGTTNKLNVSQVLIYTGSLSDSQIDNVIDNLKNSNSITFGDKINAVNN